MSRHALSTIATRHQVFLERLKTQQAVDFASVLPKLSDAIIQTVAALEVGTLDALTRRELRELLTGLEEKQRELIKKATDRLLENMRELSGYETEFEHRMLQAAMGSGGLKVNLALPSLTTSWNNVTGNPLSAVGNLLEPFIGGWGERQVAGVNQAVMRAWGEGRTISQLMRDIRGTKSLGYKDGLVDASRRQAEAVARTATQHVSQQSRETVWNANKDLVEGYIFVATLDGKTTQQCRSLDGREFLLGKGPVPPVHVNCRSTTIPKLPKEFDFLDKGATRSSKDGYVPAGQSYYDWLKGQPASFQKETLGEARAKLFREGGLSADKFAALNLGRNFQPLSLAEMRAKEPQLFEELGIKVPPPR